MSKNVKLVFPSRQHQTFEDMGIEHILFQPLAGRCMVERVLDALVQSEYRNITIYSKRFIEKLNKISENGVPWGAKVRIQNKYFDYKNINSHEKCLVGQLDSLPNLSTSCLKYDFERTNPWSYVFHKNEKLTTSISFNNLKLDLRSPDTLLSSVCNVLSNIEGDFDFLPAREESNGVYVSRGVKIENDCKLIGPVYIGEHVKLGKDCVIGPNVSIEEGAIIGDQCRIESAWVSPCTIVADKLNLKNLITNHSNVYSSEFQTKINLEKFILSQKSYGVVKVS